jgi:hypothetical protein
MDQIVFRIYSFINYFQTCFSSGVQDTSIIITNTIDDVDGQNTSAEASELQSVYDFDKTWTLSDFPIITFS